MAINYKNKSPLRRLFYSRITLILLGIIVVYMIIGTWGVYQKASLAKIQKERLEQELIELETRRADLEARLNELSTDRGIEEEIRERYSVAKKGESVVVLVDTSDEDLKQLKNNSNTSRWWNNFLGLFK